MKGLRALAGLSLLLLLPSAGGAAIGSELNGFGSFGVSLGAMRWFADADARRFREPIAPPGGASGASSWTYEEGSAAQVRPIGKAVFRYRVNTRHLVAIETGYGWNSYADSDDTVTSVIPTTIGIERRLTDVGGTTLSLCVGGGAYVWARRQNSRFLRDPETGRKLHAVEPGAYLGLGSEFHLSGHVTCTITSTAHYMLSVHGENFPVTLGGDDLFADLRVGVNYYFSPREGLVVRPRDAERPAEREAPREWRGPGEDDTDE
ncbi:MAG: hypothetical protein FJY75_07435 [Candidatus Eisenbacteria bacterium]|uniref:Porin family protein n=1 Tax=Eiseniibacteriota bacterium TaxID=2212470 RepID=A0A938BQV7_UNCEI|nr:hypothetical protein [Candidatus Eisenbacteria bacterium]